VKVNKTKYTYVITKDGKFAPIACYCGVELFFIIKKSEVDCKIGLRRKMSNWPLKALG